MSVTRTVSTRVTAKSPKVETKVTLDFEGCTQAQMEELAAASAVIIQQAIWRTSEVIPTSDQSIKVVELLGRPRGSGGFKPTPENMAARINKMGEAEFRETLVKMGLDEKTVQKMVHQKFPK